MSQLLSIFELTTKQVRAIASEQSVADAPMVIGDVTLIPISKLSCGFSCGGSDLAQKKAPDGLMAGAGAKVTKTPLSFLAIQNGQLTVLSVSAEEVKGKGIWETVKPILASLKEKSAAKKAAKEEAKAAAESASDAAVAEAIANIPDKQ